MLGTALVCCFAPCGLGAGLGEDHFLVPDVKRLNNMSPDGMAFRSNAFKRRVPFMEPPCWVPCEFVGLWRVKHVNKV